MIKLRKGEAIESADQDVIRMYSDYRSSRWKKVIIILAMIAGVIVASIYGLTVGSYPISFTEVWSIVFDHLLHLGDSLETLDERVVWEQRMPRLLTGIVAGAGLATAGAAMQSMMKNPLADPYTTGISSGASFGAVIAIAFSISIISLDAGTTILAFVFSLIPAAVIIALSTFKKATPSMMILAGLSVMYIFNAMNSGDNYARTVGVDVGRIRIVLLVIVSVISAAVVSFTGIIGFVGLVAPHITRIFMGSDNKLLIPASLLMGALVMVVCDIIAKSFTTTALPIGIVTSFIGGPVFLFLIIKQKKEIW
jgi:iron complex transport system permease protein